MGQQFAFAQCFDPIKNFNKRFADLFRRFSLVSIMNQLHYKPVNFAHDMTIVENNRTGSGHREKLILQLSIACCWHLEIIRSFRYVNTRV